MLTCSHFSRTSQEPLPRRQQRLDRQRCIRTNELQVWFVAQHVVDSPLMQAV